jgi:hypothetical protein
LTEATRLAVNSYLLVVIEGIIVGVVLAFGIFAHRV